MNTRPVQAYSSWMKANLAFELSQWKVAIDLYNESKFVYNLFL